VGLHDFPHVSERLGPAIGGSFLSRSIALRDFNPAYVRFESEADIASSRSHVRFASESGQRADMLECPLSAKSGHAGAAGDGCYGFATVTLVLTELAMKQFSCAA
jgi:hypothetical protein